MPLGRRASVEPVRGAPTTKTFFAPLTASGRVLAAAFSASSARAAAAASSPATCAGPKRRVAFEMHLES